MDRLVYGFAKINFGQNFEDILAENRPYTSSCSTKMMGAGAEFPYSRSVDSDLIDSSSNGSAESLERDIADMDGEDACSDSASTCSYSSKVSISQRQLPSRACKENSLKMKRRSIMKPTKRSSKSMTGDFSMLRPAEIKKIYMNKKLTNFRPTNLETIFEEPQTEKPSTSAAAAAAAAACSTSAITAADILDTSQVRFIGIRKIKRSLSCSDGIRVNKTLVKQRRARVKKVFGKRSLMKKMSLTDFLVRLNKNLDDSPAAYAAMQAEIEVMSSSSATTTTTINAEGAIDADVNSVSSKTEVVMEERIDENETEGNNEPKESLYKSNTFSGGGNVYLLSTTSAVFSDDATLS